MLEELQQGRRQRSSTAPPPRSGPASATRSPRSARRRRATTPHRLQFSAHQLKGSALNLGLPLVGATAARLEALGDAGRTSGAEDLLDQLVDDVERAVAALQEATAP